MFQTEKQEKDPKDELRKPEMSNLPDKELKVMSIKIFNEQRRGEEWIKIVGSWTKRKYKEEPNRAEEYNK